MISLSILISSGYIRVNTPKNKGVGSNLTTAPGSGVPNVPTQKPSNVPDDSGPVKVSIDDDPILGNKDAKLTFIEFSDFECPFCKSFFSTTLSQIKKDYIDTVKVKFVYRDLPLPFHQNAQKEAEAAECAREQGGDQAFFKYHDQIFARTTSNGTGLALDQLSIIANDIGLNGNQLQQCLDSGKFKDEVDKDIADASKAGAGGTPTLFIGKTTSDGIITATKVVGAQPYAVFKTIIDQQLSQ